MTGSVMIYGANGFSGRAIARRLAAAGHELVLAGRNAGVLRALAAELGASCRVFGLDEPALLASSVRGMKVVLHAAGPFIETAAPMIQACLDAGAHYLDLSGEWPAFALAQTRGPQAVEAGIMLMPGVGFTIVASDCLLARAAKAQPDATLLRVAGVYPPVMSRGTLRTALGLVSSRVIVRRDGEARTVPAGSLQRTFNFGEGERRAVAVSWPDVITGQQTTGVPNVEAYLEAPLALRLAGLAGAHAAEIYGEPAVRAALAPLGALWPESPAPLSQGAASLAVVVEAVDPWRRTTRFGMKTLDGYSVTTLTATAAVERVLAGEHPPGFQTPAGVFGADFIAGLGCAWDYDAGRTAGRDRTTAASGA